jgi:putative oxidoreductase
VRCLTSTFPDEWPGLGLLLLRLALAVDAILDVRLYLLGSASDPALITLYAQTVIGVLLGVGLWTPIAGALLAIVEIIRVVASGNLDGRPAMLAVIAISVAMLGPGQWSIDARLFGRRRIDL